MMHPCVFIIFSLVLLRLQNTTANQLLAVEGGGGDDKCAAKKCLDKERDALLQFKANLQDPDGSLSTWRPEDDDCCAWEGVICDDQTGHHVTGLHIPSAGLEGEISHSLVNLTYLNRLHLSFNSFHGTIPRSIGFMTELRYLDLSYNSFYGTIPPEFGNLTNLQRLSLEDVGICRSESLEWLSHLSHLEELAMGGISLAKANQLVNMISTLPKLSFLSLDGCELSLVVHPYSSSFLNSSSSSIHTLSLRNNNLTSSMYRWLFPLTSNKLRFLSLSGNMLDGLPKYLGNLCSLEGLYFNYNSDVVNFPSFLYNLSGCTSLTLQSLYAERSQFTGSFSDDIQKFSSLIRLLLADNHINGTISKKFWELSNLKHIDLSQNHLSGAIFENIGNSMASIINLSKNPLQGVPSTDHMSNLSYVKQLDLSSCNLGPHFRRWIQKLEKLTRLDISNTRISDTVPPEFWNMQFRYLNISFNNISGQVSDLSSRDFAKTIDLSSNSFYGPIPHLPPCLASLNLSRNKFSGGISFICQFVDGLLQFLDLSHNSLIGQIPDCLWHFKELKVLNLGHNSLSGRLPPSIGSLIELEVLYLYKNSFSGQLPLSLKNCTNLNFLDLGANRFSGNLPAWIGENLSGLYALILRSNNFFGTIPLQVCQLPNLQILDFSRNNLHGSIPSCLSNLTRMAQEGLLPPPNVHPYTAPSYSHRYLSYTPKMYNGTREEYDEEEYVDHAMIEWQGDEREFTRNLGLLKSIDLSSNNLTGNIPHELTNLHELLALNLSKNALLGEIPQQLGEMKNLLALDLSRNSLSGGIPTSMSQMTSLCYLDVSCNNLSGRIPSSTQLQSFQPSRYDGNAGLCGPPLSRKCPGDEESQFGKSEGDEEDIDEDWGWFYIGGGTGFATGFWIACGALLLNRRGRHAFFQFYDNFKDWVYVKVVVFIAKLWWIAHM
ncbi:receptor-like protein EIX2 [Lactuca sativa]|uniref:Leucine-rich repeat-containing N-terminal plant-type domain-containing protein n=1 Tax=Lactuca sativa TaxID=4236 RepID=A0A9R1X347_LACSA|nr:receptor-like protein EIX2 [Lactuca sativa]KAJ0198895.1 hypothetical protein LSAT_V11C600318020 [Lactuca sativa]